MNNLVLIDLGEKDGERFSVWCKPEQESVIRRMWGISGSREMGFTCKYCEKKYDFKNPTVVEQHQWVKGICSECDSEENLILIRTQVNMKKRWEELNPELARRKREPSRPLEEIMEKYGVNKA